MRTAGVMRGIALVFWFFLVTVSNVDLVSVSAVCPADSVWSDEICKCDFSLCEKPACDKFLNQISNSTDTPGDCCPQYSCDICPLDLIEAGNCSCAADATLTAEGNCECIDDEKSLVNGECVCDLTKCPTPITCSGNTVAVKELAGCCIQVTCTTCPSDSHPTYNRDEQVEDKCVCFPCRKPTCAEDQIPMPLRRGTNFPGTCCDLYSCMNKTCTVNATTYSNGETWYSQENGNCKCQSGISLCSSDPQPIEPTCAYGGKIYPNLSTWMEDSCTNCTCINGTSKCIAHMCEVHEDKITPNCAPLSSCKKSCDYGFKLNKYGCEICKCKQPRIYDIKCKFAELEKILDNENLDEKEVLDIINSYLHNLTASTTNTPCPTVNSAFNITHVVYIMIGFCAYTLVLCVVCMMCRKPRKMADFGKQYKYELQPITQKQKLNEYKDKNRQKIHELFTC